MPSKPPRSSERMDGPPPVLGWRDWVVLPDLGAPAIKAKIDTGALYSALHASRVEMFHRGRKRLVRFRVHPYQREPKRMIRAEAELIAYRRVRSSSGTSEVRPVIRTVLEIQGRSWPIELTLAQRETMGFRLLLGRQAIRRRFLVDPARSFLAGPRRSPR